MGTRGIYLFIYKGKKYVFYNHMDSYPESLGQMLILLIQNNDISKFGEILVDKIDNKNYTIKKYSYQNCDFIEESYSKHEDIEFEKDDSVSEKMYFTFDKTYYLYKWDILNLNAHFIFFKSMCKTFCPSLLRSHIIFSEIKMEDLDDFFLNYEWNYIINLDNNSFEIRSGKQSISFELNNIPFDWRTKLKQQFY